MQCSNCDTRAEWKLVNTGMADQPYCRRHVPSAYRGLPQLHEVPVEEAPDAEDLEVKEEAPSPAPKPRPRKRASQ